MSTRTRPSESGDTFEELAARYEAEHDAPELATMLAREQIDRYAAARRSERTANSLLVIVSIGAVVALGSLAATVSQIF
jgi:hypothetical protein